MQCGIKAKIASLYSSRKAVNSATGKRFQQKGVVLVLTLVFLIIVTVIATSGMQNTILEQRMATNLEDYSLAMQGAEAALEAAEEWLKDRTGLPSPVTAGTAGIDVWSTSALGLGSNSHWWKLKDLPWWQNNAETLTGFEAIVATGPAFIIEEYSVLPASTSVMIGQGNAVQQRVFHRITARSSGGTENVVVTLQTTYAGNYD